MKRSDLSHTIRETLKRFPHPYDAHYGVVPPPPPVDHRRVMRTTRHFDERGRLVRWPGKASERQLCLWALWSRIPARTVFTEPQVNAMLDAGHLFGDYAVLRRGLCDDGLVSRTIDGREYRRVERRPPVDAAALIGHLKQRLGQPRQ